MLRAEGKRFGLGDIGAIGGCEDELDELPLLVVECDEVSRFFLLTFGLCVEDIHLKNKISHKTGHKALTLTFILQSSSSSEKMFGLKLGSGPIGKSSLNSVITKVICRG